MLAEYLDNQKIVTTILCNALSSNKLNHAYLFESNGNTEVFNIALAFAKAILCPKNYIKSDKCQNCVQCTQIDNKSFSELKIIEPDGLWIKKEQLEDLQKEFSKTAVQASKKVYIIKQAERLNPSAANSILKFLEEPEENIIAILITDNIYQMLETIISRCQIISLNKMKLAPISTNLEKYRYYFNLELDDESLISKITQFQNFIQTIERHGCGAIASASKILGDVLKEKEDYFFLFDYMVFFYKDCLNYYLKQKLQLFTIEEVKPIVEKNNIRSLTKKVEIILSLKERITYNVNTNLLLDKLIITMSKVVI